MLRITIIAPDDMREAYFRDACAEYIKRLSGDAAVTVASFAPVRLPDDPSDAQVRAALEAEGDRILALVPKRAHTVALCIEGRQLTSEQLAATVERAAAEVGAMCFIIGSSCGLCERVKAAADARLSLSALTLPHRLARVVLLEALYRSVSIARGRKYHK